MGRSFSYCKYCEQDFTHTQKNAAAPFRENERCALGVNNAQVHFSVLWIGTATSNVGVPRHCALFSAFHTVRPWVTDTIELLSKIRWRIWVLVFHKSEPVSWQTLAVGINPDITQPFSSASSLMHGHGFMSPAIWGAGQRKTLKLIEN